MALINCPECGREVSDSAAKCPNCGYPISGVNAKTKNKLPLGIILIVVIFLVSIVSFGVIMYKQYSENLAYEEKINKIQGFWKMTKVSFDGSKYYDLDVLYNMIHQDFYGTLKVENEEFTLKFRTIGENESSTGTWKVDNEIENSIEYRLIDTKNRLNYSVILNVSDDTLDVHLELRDGTDAYFFFERY